MNGLRRMGADIYLLNKTKTRDEDYDEIRRYWDSFKIRPML
jgi:hypothetical protein